MRNCVLFCLLAFFHCSTSTATELPDTSQYLHFNYLSVNNGLSQNSVTCILQDKKGFIWIGTYDGLNRYDGFSVTTRRHESANENSLSDNRIKCLYEDEKGKILIGTESGDLNIYDPVFDKFAHFTVNEQKTDEKDILTVRNDASGNLWIGTTSGIIILDHHYAVIGKLLPQCIVNSLICDSNNNMWIATSQGLFFNKAGNAPTALVNIKEAGNTAINIIFEDRKKKLWLGAGTALSRLSMEGQGYPYVHITRRSYPVFPKGKEGEITAIQQDLNGDIWIGNRLHGLFQYQLDDQDIPVLKKWYATGKPFCNISDNPVSAMLVDRSNVLWAGTFQQGVNYANLSMQKFYPFFPLLSSQNSELGYKGKFVTAICEKDNRLWIGTSTEGLFSYDFQQKSLSSYENVLGNRWISSLFVGRNRNMWIGTSQGLYKILPDSRQPQLAVPGLNIHALAEDRYGHIWITTWEGVYIYDQATQALTTINTQNGLSSNYTFLVYADPVFPAMWVSTLGNGLNKIVYNKTGNYTITTYRHQKKEPGSLTSNYIWSIYRDSSAIMWLGTDAGLDRVQLDKNGNPAGIRYINHNQLEDRKILSILKDDDGNLWLNNSQGLFRYNPQKNEVKRYSHKDGLQSNTLTEAAWQNANGIMYVGGINGLNFFDPKEILDNPFPTQLALTELRIFNTPVQAGQRIDGHLILEKDINNTERIVLKHTENNFILHFASLHFAAPENNLFKYRLEGYDKEWIVTNATQRFAAYSNLPAGSYTFLITASNNDGSWNKDLKKIIFTIQPAPWATWWAKTIYLLIITGIGFAILKYFQSRRTLKEQVFKEKLEKEKVTELNEIKLNFFTNITHELRTPLNLIMGPASELLDKAPATDEFSKLRLNIIHKNSQRLFTLINQVLDLRKISSDSNRLFIAHDDIVKTIADVKQSFNWTAEQKHIQYDFTFHPVFYLAWYDKDKVEKIAFNLLSNAFKYTPEGGSITVDVTIEAADTAKPVATLTVQDTGPGIDPEDMGKIFDLFYQGNKQSNLGSGIGLALVNKLTEIHHGKMTVTSDKDCGATFKVSIPVGINSFMPDDIVETKTSEAQSALHDVPVPPPAGFPKKDTRPGILIVEDNEDQTDYVKEHLKDLFRVYQAGNGEDGLLMATKYLPDIILTDLMMPGIDGIELCRRLKENVRTSHIPILIHSVKSTGDAVKLALEAGASDFIPKPCDYRLLRLKINNILQSNLQLLANQYKEDLTAIANVPVPDHDAALLKKVVEIIEKNMTDPGFTVEMLSREVAMSRMHLHRRLNDIVGKTASELIREIKMKRAAQLLEKGSMRVSEVMYEVGISNYNLFNKYFKDIYGVAPKNYKKEL